MLHNFVFRNKIIRVLEDRLTNWEQKGFLISTLIERESNGLAVFTRLVEKHWKVKIRKGAASVAAYMKYKQVTPLFIGRIFLEKDWRVRYALSSTTARLIGSEAIEKLQNKYNELLLQQTDNNKKYFLTVHYAESLSSMGLEATIPILIEMLEQAISHQRKQSNSLIVQILYGLGEVGNEEVIDVLLAKRNANAFFAESVKNSAHHALDKLAKKYGASSIFRYLEKRGEN